MATPAPNWMDEVEFEFESFKVSPNIDCTDTIARTTGKWTVRLIWIEWATPAFVQQKIDDLVADGWVVEEFGSPTKPQEELDIWNTTITAKKRVAA